MQEASERMGSPFETELRQCFEIRSAHYRLQRYFNVFLKVSSIFTCQYSNVCSEQILHLILDMDSSVILPLWDTSLRNENRLLSKQYGCFLKTARQCRWSQSSIN